MKKLSLILFFALFITILILPVSKFVFSRFGYTFELCSNTVYSAIIAILSAGTLIVFLITDAEVSSKPLCVLMAIIPILNLISCIVYLFPVKIENKLMFGFALVSIVCCCGLCAVYAKSLTLQVITLTFSGLMIAVMWYVGVFSFVFSNIGSETLVMKVDSPDSYYYTEVINSDQGALGGNTCVYISKTHGDIDAGLFKLYQKPQMVYYGEWYEYKTIKVSWKDNDTLYINSEEYDIK